MEFEIRASARRQSNLNIDFLFALLSFIRSNDHSERLIAGEVRYHPVPECINSVSVRYQRDQVNKQPDNPGKKSFEMPFRIW